MASNPSRLTRIGVFYDGNYFLHVSNYYNFQHSRRSRISIRGLHEFIRHQVAIEEDTQSHLCPVVDAHYFRGRLKAHEAKEMNKLYAERVFDDILINEGVVTHYLPLRNRRGKREERGVDVWLALEAFDQARAGNYDVVALIVSDGDYTPLIRKLQNVGTRVMLLSWEFEFVDDFGETRETRTAHELLELATYPIAMHDIIEQPDDYDPKVLNNLFVSSEPGYERDRSFEFDDSPAVTYAEGEARVSVVDNMLNGYGFIRATPNNLFFHYSDVVDGDFNDLERGDTVEFTIGHNDKGICARNVRRVPASARTAAAAGSYGSAFDDDADDTGGASVGEAAQGDALAMEDI